MMIINYFSNHYVNSFKYNRISINPHWIIVICILTFPLNAQTTTVQFPGYTIPKKPLMNFRGEYMYVTVVVSDASLKNSPSRMGADLPNPPKFLDTLLAYERTKDNRYYLLKTQDGRWGWMKSNEILVSSVCLRSDNKNNPAFIKVLLSNSMKKTNKGKYIAFYKGPGKSYQKNVMKNKFTIYYAFKKILGNDGNMYFFIGDRPTWDYHSSDRPFLGWINQKNCILWDNQVAVYYDKETLKQRLRKTVPIFQQKTDLTNHLISGTRENVLIEEPHIYSELSPLIMPFPVINHDGNRLKIAWINHEQKNPIYYTGWCSVKDIYGTNQFNSFCLMGRFKLDAMVGLFGIIIDGSRYASKKIEKLINDACLKSTGAPVLNNETLSEYLQRVFHIPVSGLSKELNKTPHDIQNDFLIHKKYKDRFIKNIQKSYHLLHLMQERKMTEIKWVQSKKKWVNINKPVKKEWFFLSSEGYEYCWIPFDSLP